MIFQEGSYIQRIWPSGVLLITLGSPSFFLTSSGSLDTRALTGADVAGFVFFTLFEVEHAMRPARQNATARKTTDSATFRNTGEKRAKKR
jgi:hypothetical protein